MKKGGTYQEESELGWSEQQVVHWVWPSLIVEEVLESFWVG
jgi:hypothetical protein